jgi:hypothetical protein
MSIEDVEVAVEVVVTGCGAHPGLLLAVFTVGDAANCATPSLLFMNNHDGTFREEGFLQIKLKIVGDESRKISSQPSLSKSKKAQPQPRVSTMYSLRSLSP